MLNKNLVLIALVVFATGCGLETRTYVMTKDRVGLDQNGNAGCVVGKCAPVVPTKTTRKVYVLEITKPVPESEVQKIEQTAVTAIVDTPATSNGAAAANTPAAAVNPQPAAAPERVIPVVGDEPASAATVDQAGASAPAGTYTVLKDDTLQKISKKVYGTYGKWYSIYKANKDKISNPNFVKPGTVLTIPASK